MPHSIYPPIYSYKSFFEKIPVMINVRKGVCAKHLKIRARQLHVGVYYDIFIFFKFGGLD